MKLFEESDFIKIKNYDIISDEEVDGLKAKIFRAILNVDDKFVSKDCKVGFERVPMNTGIELEGYTINVVDRGHNPLYALDVSTSGNLVTIRKIIMVDIEEAKRQDIRMSFPLENKITIKDGELWNGDTKINIVNLYSNDHDFTIDENLRWVDRGDGNFIITSKEDYSNDIHFVYLDRKTDLLYIWESYSYDYPEMVAIRENNGKLEMFLNNDDRERKIIYHDPKLRPFCTIDNLHSNSNWVKLDNLDNFRNLKSYIEFYNSQQKDNKMPLSTYISKYTSQGEEYTLKGDRQLAYDNYKLVRECPSSKNYYGFLSHISAYTMATYNMACCMAVLGEKDKAHSLLPDIVDDWVDWDHLENDLDFINLRDDQEFKDFIKKYRK